MERLRVDGGNRATRADAATDLPLHFANLANVSFADALLLFPAMVVIHICEEWPRFPRWARRFGSPTYSDRDYIVTHALAIVAASAFVMLLRAFPSSPMLFVFFGLIFGPGAFWNAWFISAEQSFRGRIVPAW